MNDTPAAPIDDASPLVSLPWPAAAIDMQGMIMAANPAFIAVFPGCEPGHSTVDDYFGNNHDGLPASHSLPIPANVGDAWQGNWAAAGDAGQYRLMITRDARAKGLRWVFLPENPMIDGRPRVNPRSELEIARMVLDHSPDFLFLRDNTGAFLFSSRSFAEFLGVPREGYETGKTIDVFVTRDCHREFERLDEETRSKSTSTRRQRFQLETAAGVRRLVDITQEPVRNKAGSPVGILSFARDITSVVDRENKLHLALEEARSAGQAKGFFVANVSHEIRTPINGILGMAELCLDTGLTLEQRKYVQAVLDCGRTLLTLVNDILDFSKIEAGRLTFENIDFEIESILAEAASQFAPKAHSRGVEVVLDADPALPRRLRGDPTRIRQIVYNLVSNAIKFTENGHVVISARIMRRADDHLRLAIDIADTGIGIPQEKLTTIFEAFTQADSTTTRRFGGTGLGLAIAKRLAEMMNGALTVNSRVGVGSVFTAEFELDIAETEEPPEIKPLEGRTVGILSEDPVQRETLARSMRALGARVEEAAGGVDAFRLVMSGAGGAKRTDLLIADYPVTGTGSHEMVDLIVGRAAGSGIAIITLAALKNVPHVLGRLRNANHRHVVKPAIPGDLRTVALGLLGLHVAPEPQDTSDAETPSRVLRVLLAEDNPVNQELALRRLEKLGHRVDVADDGGKAWQFITSKRYDVALLDVQMPVLDGLRLAKRIRQMEYGTPAHLPLIALTALAMESDKKECLEAGFDNFLSKPFLIDDLRKLLDSITAPRSGGGTTSENTPAGPRRMSQPTPPRVTRSPLPTPRSAFNFENILRACPETEAEDLLIAGEVFLGYWEKETTALDEARERNDLPTLAAIAHRIKGGVTSLKAKTAGEVCVALEEATKRGDTAEIDNHLRKLVDELQAVADGIRRAIEASKRPRP